MVASEATPLAKTGGLADVLGSLPKALADLGHEVGVVLPRYKNIALDEARLAYSGMKVWVHGSYHLVDVWTLARDGAIFYLLDVPYLYDRNGIYGDRFGDFGDNHLRYAVLSLGALGVARHLFRPDVIHAHDWQAGLVPLYLKRFFPADPTFAGVKTLFTIHNLGYQGLFRRSVLWDIGLDDRFFESGLMEFDGAVSLMKAGILEADWLSTVSPRYAQEIQTPEYGFRMDGLLRARSNALSGILNGVDYTAWNPETDRTIAQNYSVRELEGKAACKAALLRQFGLDSEEARERPLIGIVSRFAEQKGFDLIAQVYHELASQDATIIALGTGDSAIEKMFQSMEADYGARVKAYIGYSEPLAHQITAGADLFLMPSRYEPCGLNQMYSLRYGTLPVVRATGGLDDTIDGETGFKFWGFQGWELLLAVRHALEAFASPDRWKTMVRTAMGRDFGWDRSAVEYVRLYRGLTGKR